MVTIDSEIVIAAPRPMCFDLARDVSVHTRAQSHRKERVVSGRLTGLLELGDTITFEAVHFGIRQRLTSKIVSMRVPDQFVDQMQSGAFKSLRHTHSFLDHHDGTLMRDKLEFEAPLGLLGTIAERCFLEHYMRRFLVRHQRSLRQIAEPCWELLRKTLTFD